MPEVTDSTTGKVVPGAMETVQVRSSSGPTVTDPTRMWAVTGLQHPAVRDVSPVCKECLALTNDAITDARITGSRGATRTERGHSVHVSRVHALAVLS